MVAVMMLVVESHASSALQKVVAPGAGHLRHGTLAPAG